MNDRNYTPADKLCLHLDQALRTIFGKPITTGRANPAEGIAEATLSETEQRQAQGYMRINHCGEVCAQALYQGQAITARDASTRLSMEHAAQEENDHLAWCETRINELGSHTSYLNPLWYIGSLSIGIIAGIAGDKWSLGFVAETESQVTAHLNKHAAQLSQHDKKSLAIIKQMAIDEKTHEQTAINAGANSLPTPIKKLMNLTAKLMTKTTYWI